MGADDTADALEYDLLRVGVDLLDLYRGLLSLRRVCVLVTHLPDDAAVWRVHHPDAGWTRADLLVAVLERRVTALWAVVAGALGHQATAEQLASPLDALADAPPHPAARTDEPETLSMREIAVMMRGG